MESELVNFVRGVCLPAKIYFALFLVNLLIAFIFKIKNRDITIMLAAFVIMFFVGLGITWFGNYLCNHGYEIVPWVLVLLPLLSLVRNLRKIIFVK